MQAIHKEIILYERVQAEYDCFIEELVQLNQALLSWRIHELRLKTMILELIIEERYTKEELDYLIKEEKPLEILYNLLIDYI